MAFLHCSISMQTHAVSHTHSTVLAGLG